MRSIPNPDHVGLKRSSGDTFTARQRQTIRRLREPPAGGVDLETTAVSCYANHVFTPAEMAERIAALRLRLTGKR